MLDDNPPKLSAGFGGWREEQRSKTLSATVWEGQPLMQYTISVIFDGWKAKTSVQSDVDLLNVMALPVLGGQPPKLKLTSPAALTKGFINNLDWVITDIDWNGSMRESDGVLYRQNATITFLQFQPPDVVLKNVKKSSSTKTRTRRIYIVKRGDTLHKIAMKELGVASRWRELAKLNNIRDPRSSKKLRVGKRLKLP